MRQEKSQRHFRIYLIYENNRVKTVDVKAGSRATAERRALKRNPGSIGIKHE